MKYVDRTMYMGRMRPFVSNGNVKIVTGIRRSGKSTLLKELNGFLEKKVLRINMELWYNHKYRDPETAYRYIRESIDGGVEAVIIDEVQDIDHWYDIVRSLVAEEECDLYISGSNSKLLSGEFASLLTGRYNLFGMFTLTYSECIEFAKEYQDEKTEILPRFLHVGGFPSVWRNRYAESDALLEVSDILGSIMMHDIIARYNVRRPDLLHRILRFFCDNIGNKSSINNIYNTLVTEDRKLAKDLVYQYVDHLESACLIYKAETYDVKGKKILGSSYKYYLADIGLKNAVCGYRPEDINGYVENIVFLEMRARGYEVWIGDYAGKEVDFVCKRGREFVYIQATTELSNEDVVRREFGNLMAIPDNHSKYVVAMRSSPLDSDLDGVRFLLLEDFLLKKDL